MKIRIFRTPINSVIGTFVTGLITIADGLLNILSIGFLKTNLRAVCIFRIKDWRV